VLEKSLAEAKESYNVENSQLKNKLNEVLEVQKSLKEKFDSNVHLLEQLITNEQKMKEFM